MFTTVPCEMGLYHKISLSSFGRKLQKNLGIRLVEPLLRTAGDTSEINKWVLELHYSWWKSSNRRLLQRSMVAADVSSPQNKKKNAKELEMHLHKKIQMWSRWFDGSQMKRDWAGRPSVQYALQPIWEKIDGWMDEKVRKRWEQVGADFMDVSMLITLITSATTVNSVQL